MLRRSRSLSSLVVAAIAIGAFVPGACVEYEELNSGGVEGLNGKQLPSPTFPAGAAAGGDSGTTPVATLCDGKPPVSDPNCTVKWKSQIYEPYVKPGGAWKCSDITCHGGQVAVYKPAISDTDATAAWISLVGWRSPRLNNKRYVDACSKVPEDSAMKCNLTGACPPQMPQTGGAVGAKSGDPAGLDLINQWLACGAPNN